MKLSRVVFNLIIYFGDKKHLSLSSHRGIYATTAFPISPKIEADMNDVFLLIRTFFRSYIMVSGWQFEEMRVLFFVESGRHGRPTTAPDDDGLANKR
jgi:hypothetical protein